jgi:hypothetical protein
VAWNGLAVGALARTGAALEAIDPAKAQECLSAAEKAVEFIQKALFDADTATLWRIYREGRGDAPGFCDDYAFLIQGLIDLYEATFNDKYLKFADVLQSSSPLKTPHDQDSAVDMARPQNPSSPSFFLARHLPRHHPLAKRAPWASSTPRRRRQHRSSFV